MSKLPDKLQRSAVSANARNSANDLNIVKATFVTNGLLTIPEGYVSKVDDRTKSFSKRCLLISIIFGAWNIGFRIGRYGYKVKGEGISKLAENMCGEASKFRAMDFLHEEYQRILKKYPFLDTNNHTLNEVGPILTKEYGKF